jgi:hypothetical protein
VGEEGETSFPPFLLAFFQKRRHALEEIRLFGSMLRRIEALPLPVG